MKDIHGTQSVEVIDGRKVVLSAGEGQTNVEDLVWLKENVLSKVGGWKATGWAYIADCTKMKPVGPDEVGPLVDMTKAFVEAAVANGLDQNDDFNGKKQNEYRFLCPQG